MNSIRLHNFAVINDRLLEQPVILSLWFFVVVY